MTPGVPCEGESIFGRRARPDYKIDHDTGCWNWLKAKTPRGYSTIHAHRKYWARANGPIPDGFHVHHKCENPSCVNPDHLEAIPPRSHFDHHHNRLGFDAIQEIRRLGTVPGVSARQVAKQFGVTDMTVYRWWNAKTWRPELGTEIQRPDAWPCAREGCEEMVTGNRHKKYCTPRCRSMQNRWDTGVKPTPSRWRTP